MDRFRRLISGLKSVAASSGHRLASLLLTFSLLSAMAEPGLARPRVETGRDLFTFCQLAADQQLAHPGDRLSGKARYCRQYVSGFFGSLRAMQVNEGTQRLHDNDDPDRFQCALVPRTASFEQLERQIIRFGEWNPELLDEPAIRLIQRAFSSLDPC
ncbi:MAG: hypothetical protein COA62_11430 [Rhodobiaceae bacterium]|nr:MAG: hypothetical protein COA62_11430 [Rhodobiaceae bacterium]